MDRTGWITLFYWIREQVDWFGLISMATHLRKEKDLPTKGCDRIFIRLKGSVSSNLNTGICK